MKFSTKPILVLIVAIAWNTHLVGKSNQPDNSTPHQTSLITAADSIKLSSLPPLLLDESALRRSLPAVVDNSEQIFMRPVFLQSGWVCNQSATIAYLFTYEINNKRNLPGDDPENQYTDHFAYAFLNNGIETAGVSYYESFEVVKKLGTPNIDVYGGLDEGGYSRWMNGYDNYYQAMHNRINQAYSIKLDSPEGLQTLKNWIYDHGSGSQAGGLASFSVKFSSPYAMTLPPNTPEAGKKVVVQWDSPADHAMTIVGYNDSIRYDYNGDGQYTNHLDINGDGVVDMRDWEIGGFKFVNSYGLNWADQGYAYMMYKTVADHMHEGGIWNHMVVVADVKDEYEPLLTAKVKMTHPCRSSIKIMAGYTEDSAATEPDYVLHFPVFDFQGGCFPMQGPYEPNGDTIEFGLDLNPLLSYVISNQEGKFFLMLQEDDPDNLYQGEVLFFSIRDYSGPLTEYEADSPVSIINNSVTSLTVTASLDPDRPTVETAQLPEAVIQMAYEVQLEASGGTPPYRWRLVDDYNILYGSDTFPTTNHKQLTFSNPGEGIARIELPFEFPFYDASYDELFVAVDGFIIFEESLVPWPYYIEGKTYIMQNRLIAPFLCKPFMIEPDFGDGIWYELEDESVTIRWEVSESSNPANTYAGFAVRLTSDGTIAFIYDDYNIPPWSMRFAGISAGNGENHIILNTNENFNPEPLSKVIFSRSNQHHGLQLNSNGLLSGKIDQHFSQNPIKVSVTDHNNIKAFHMYELDVAGIEIIAKLHDSPDQFLYAGQTYGLDVSFINHNSDVFDGGELILSSEDPNIIVQTSSLNLGSIQPADSLLLENVFELVVSETMPDMHRISLQFQANQVGLNREFDFTGRSPAVKLISSQLVEDEVLKVSVWNASPALFAQPVASISTENPYIEIIDGEQSSSMLQQGTIWHILFQLSLDEDMPSNETPLFHLNISNGTIVWETAFELRSTAVEDFESSGFESFEWQMAGHQPWHIENSTNPEGDQIARSGQISHLQFSSLILDWEVVEMDSISFFYKISSEEHFDHLSFAVDGIEWAKWSGEHDWSYAVFPVTIGEKRFSWTYNKDVDNTSGEDAAWLDFIVLPGSSFSTSVGEFKFEQSMVKVYPNPSAGYINVEVALENHAIQHIEIIDAMGHLVYTHQPITNSLSGKHLFRIGIQDLSSGFYTILVQTTEGQQIAKKLIITGRY